MSLWVILGISVITIVLADDSCISERYSGVPGHTGCLPKPSYAHHYREMTDEIRDRIVDTHNSMRGSLDASDMQKMVWDEELAQLAQKWSDHCVFQHDASSLRSIPARFNVGQNLALGYHNWTQVLNSWWNEKDDFHYDQQYRMDFGKVGHFTQMAWAKSAKVGCAWTLCTNQQMKQFYGGRYFVCNYAPAGNIQWWKPYELANSEGISGRCSSCPDTCDENGQCDCSGKVCENGGTLDPNTCQCTCTKPYHTSDICALDCDAAVDNRFCNRIWSKSHCDRFFNVPFECPHMCGVCPLADYKRYTTNNSSTTSTVVTTTTAPSTTTPTTTTIPMTTTTPATTAKPTTTTPSSTTTSPTTTTSASEATTTVSTHVDSTKSATSAATTDVATTYTASTSTASTATTSASDPSSTATALPINPTTAESAATTAVEATNATQSIEQLPTTVANKETNSEAITNGYGDVEITGITHSDTTATATGEDKKVNVEIKQQDGKTVITIPRGRFSYNGAPYVQRVETSRQYSTLVLILQMLPEV